MPTETPTWFRSGIHHINLDTLCWFQPSSGLHLVGEKESIKTDWEGLEEELRKNPQQFVKADSRYINLKSVALIDKGESAGRPTVVRFVDGTFINVSLDEQTIQNLVGTALKAA